MIDFYIIYHNYTIEISVCKSSLIITLFFRIARENVYLLDRIMRGDLVIPEFSQFKKEINDIYTFCAGNNDGEVSISVNLML